MTDNLAVQAAQRSMEAVLGKDKDAWVNNFAEDGVVQDPVGKSPLDPEGNGHRGREAISNFWDMLIATGDIKFEIRESYPAGANAVANVGSIINTMPGGGQIEAKGVFVYTVNDEGKVLSLQAYWDFDTTMAAASQL